MADRSVLVTGASTGIGRACAISLASQGLHVFAGVRKIADGEMLRAVAGDGLEPILLDVTNADQIASAASWVENSTGELAGIVCNAGVAVAGPLELLPLDQLRFQMEVNVVGQVAVVQAFLPQLRRSRGRIVLMSSIGGRIGQPMVGAYCASKHALEAVGDALRLELLPWGIRVSLVEPGAVRTPIWDKGLAAASSFVEVLPPEARRLYGTAIEAMRPVAEREAAHGIEPERVADVVFHALTSSRPRSRYPVGRDARLGVLVRRLLPDSARDFLLMRITGLPRTAEVAEASHPAATAV